MSYFVKNKHLNVPIFKEWQMVQSLLFSLWWGQKLTDWFPERLNTLNDSTCNVLVLYFCVFFSHAVFLSTWIYFLFCPEDTRALVRIFLFFCNPECLLRTADLKHSCQHKHIVFHNCKYRARHVSELCKMNILVLFKKKKNHFVLIFPCILST